MWILILIGAILRIARWLHWRSLWLDEIYLADSVRVRSLHDLLFTPLENWQAAPPGFLILVHWVVRAFGAGERSLRLVSLLFGLISLPLMAAVARRLLGGGAAVFAMTLFVVLAPLIYYSNELKPYSSDVACSLAVTLCALRLIEKPSAARALVAAVVGGISVFFSYPAVFVLAGAGLLVLMQTRGKVALGVGVVWGIVFVGDYAVFVRPFTGGPAYPHLVDYWLAWDAFMPRSPLAIPHWLMGRLEAVSRDTGAMWMDYPDVAVVAILIGLATAVYRRSKFLVLIWPLPFVLIACALRRYPLGDRLALFLVPQLLLLIALAIGSLWTNFPGKVAAVILAGMILIPPARRAANNLVSPPGREESLQAYRWIAGQWHRGDVLYLSQFAEPSFEYYRDQVAWPANEPAADCICVQPYFAQPTKIVDLVQSLAGKRRVWVALIHTAGGPVDIGDLTLAAFDGIGRRDEAHVDEGAKVYLYDCSTADVGR